MKLAIGCDHAGLPLKAEVLAYLEAQGIEYTDYGCYDSASCDYPDMAVAPCEAVVRGECEYALLFCGTGIGISMAANKIDGIRACACSDCFSAHMTRLHNNANVLCMGSRVVGAGLAVMLVEQFLSTGFEGGRHTRRVDKIDALGARLNK